MTASKSLVDMNRLRDAIDGHAHAVSTVKKHRIEIDGIKDKIKELDYEIVGLSNQVREMELGHYSISMDDIISSSHKKIELNNRITALNDAVGKMNKLLRDKTREYEALDVYAESDCITSCWQIIYDGILKSIDVEPLNQLITLGTKINKPINGVVADLKLVDDTRRLEAFAKQFNLPV